MAESIINKHVKCDQICYAENFVKNRSIRVACNWQDYDLLIINAAYYDNHVGTVIVPVTYFANTNSSNLMVLMHNHTNGGTQQVWQEGEGYVGMRMDMDSSGTHGFVIYGLQFN